MVTLTGFRPEAEQVNTSVVRGATRRDDLAGNAHRQLIGWIGLVLPFVLIGLAIWRDRIEQWRNLESISAYYYTGANAAFVGMLVALALFLFTYRGYRNKYHKYDLVVAIAAGGAAVVVAFFPTRSPDGVPALLWWAPWIGVVHHVAAIGLFSMFAVFALWLFRRTADGETETPDKRWRNRFYLGCGVVIVVAMGWAGLNAFNGKPIFWPESVALGAFALSWLVKGYAHRTILRAARSLLSR